MMKLIAPALAFLVCATATPHAAPVQWEDGMVAVVNDAVILRSDLDQRFQLSLRQTNGNLSPMQRLALYKKNLADMVDEELIIQYATPRGMTVSKDELRQAEAMIIQNNKLSQEAYATLVKGIEAEARDKVAAQVRWNKVVNRAVRPDVIVSNIEIDRLIQGMMTAKDVKEYEIAQIFLSAEGENGATAAARIKDIATQVNTSATSSTAVFAQLARTYSEDSNARQGGYMGWFAAGEILPELDKVITTMAEGAVSKPIQSSSGWHILKLERTRITPAIQTTPVAEWDVWLVSAQLPADKKAKKQLLKSLNNLADDARSATDIETFLANNKENTAFAGSKHVGWIQPDALPTVLRSSITKPEAKPRANRAGEVVENEAEAQVLFIAATRSKVSEKLEEYRTRVRERLTDNRTELASRRFLRDLRQKAYIDIRLGGNDE
ncbi:MAG: peptidylprolyl isomerase [Alphaproteobacteria bacterium]